MVAQIDTEFRRLGRMRLWRRYLSYAMFEGRPATTRGQWFNPVVFAWLRILAAWPGRPHLRAPVFITGLGRSGTTILGMVLAAHRDIGYLNEPKALWHLVDPRTDVNGNFGHAGDRWFRLDASEAHGDAALRAQRLYARYAAMLRVRYVIDKYPELVFRIPYVRALLPGARFIFLHRHGADACQSIVQWSRFHGVGAAGQREDWWGRGDLKWRLLWDQLILPDPAYADLAAVQEEALGDVDRAAIEWITAMREGLKQAANYPEAVLRIGYESLLFDPERELDRLSHWIGIPEDPDMLDYARRVLHPNAAKSIPELNGVVRRHFDTTLAQLGYAPAPS